MKLRICLMFILLLIFAPISSISAQSDSPTSQRDTPLLYRVAFVSGYDPLDVHSSPRTRTPISGKLPLDSTDISITGKSKIANQVEWVPIQSGEVTGWVKRDALTEQVTSADFCASPVVTQLVDDLKSAITARDGAQLSKLVAPDRGLLIRASASSPEIHLLPDEVLAFFTSETSYDWGTFQGAEEPYIGTAADVIVPKLDADLLHAEQTDCDQMIGGAGSDLMLPSEYVAVNYVSLYRPPPADPNHGFDWATWVVGIEYWDGQPHLSYLVHYTWEI
jgi:hypothetical protein